jgi:hypothetical protein
LEHLKLTFVAAKSPPSHIFFIKVTLLEAKETGAYCPLAAAERFLFPIGSSNAVFAVIDIASWPAIYSCYG